MNKQSGDEFYNVREILAPLIGQKVIDITQHDQDEVDSGEEPYIELLLSEGDTLKVYLSENGFDATVGDEFYSIGVAVEDADEDED